jgi:glycosyltransferase involved in cell wall biosynthesis
VFVLQRLAALARQPGVELQVASPVPTFPVFTRLRGNPGPRRHEWDGLTAHRPRFFYVPGLLKSLDGRFYARGLRRWLANLCRRWQPELLDAHFVWPDGVGVWRLARAVGLPYAITLRGWLYEAVKYPRILRQCVKALQGASAIVSLSSHLAKTAVELGAPSEKIHVIPNGVDVKRFKPRDRHAARRELGLPETGRLVVTVAHLGERKGHRETIRALARVPADVQLVLVGGDTRGTRDAESLRELSRSLGVADRVLLMGKQPYDRVPLCLAAADVSVLASWREGCPNVVLESLAAGTPVVASDVGGVSADLIGDGPGGRVVPPRQVDPLAEAIQELLDRPPSPQEVRNTPSVRTWDEVAADVHAALRRAVECGAQSSGLSDDSCRAAAVSDGSRRNAQTKRDLACR